MELILYTYDKCIMFLKIIGLSTVAQCCGLRRFPVMKNNMHVEFIEPKYLIVSVGATVGTFSTKVS